MSSKVVEQVSLEKEYNKDTGITRDDIATFRQWLKTQPHLPEQFITDLDLILTYHSCERSIEVSKQVLDLNLTLKTLFTSFFKDRCVDAKTEKTLNTILFAPLPTRARDGSAVLYAKLLDTDPKNFCFAEGIRLVLMVIELWQHAEGTWPGFVMVFDLEGVKMGHLSKLGLQELRQYSYYLQEAMPVKIKSIHYFNSPSFVDGILTLVRPFLKKEILDMLFIHQVKSTTIDQYVDMKAFPKEAGGEYLTCQELKEKTLEFIRGGTEYLQQENKKRVCESKRPGKPKTISDIFGGVEGSFKKLDID